MKVINYDSKVFYTGKGRHFHMFDDCRTLWQGISNSVKYGRELWAQDVDTYDDALTAGLYGCITCHKRLGVEVPEEASLKAAMAKRAEAREAKRAAKAAAQAPVAVVEVIDEPNVTLQSVDALIADIYAMLAKLEAAVA